MTPDPMLKVCGITRLVDAMHAVREGATALGFVFWPDSPRCINAGNARDIIAALPDGPMTVGVFVNASAQQVQEVVAVTGVKAVQLHGDENAREFDTLGCPLFRSVTRATTPLLAAHKPFPVCPGHEIHVEDLRPRRPARQGKARRSKYRQRPQKRH